MKKIASIILTAMILIAIPTATSAITNDESNVFNSRPGQLL